MNNWGYNKSKTLVKCGNCGVPAAECLGSDVFRNHVNILQCGEYQSEWICNHCYRDGQILCCHCDHKVGDSPLPEPLDDGTYVCTKCNKKLLEELDEYTSHNKSYTK